MNKLCTWDHFSTFKILNYILLVEYEASIWIAILFCAFLNIIILYRINIFGGKIPNILLLGIIYFSTYEI